MWFVVRVRHPRDVCPHEPWQARFWWAAPTRSEWMPGAPVASVVWDASSAACDPDVDTYAAAGYLKYLLSLYLPVERNIVSNTHQISTVIVILTVGWLVSLELQENSGILNGFLAAQSNVVCSKGFDLKLLRVHVWVRLKVVVSAEWIFMAGLEWCVYCLF